MHTTRLLRREFVEHFCGFVGLAGVAVSVDASALGAQTTRHGSKEEWLQGLKGKHRQLFDLAAIRDGNSLRRVANFLDVYREAYALADADLNAIVGAHGGAFGLVL